MKRLIIAFAALAIAAIPAAGVADDIQNPNQCKAEGDGVFIDAEADEQDRGSGCINVGGVQVLYIGGELEPENADNAGEPCGAIVVLDEEISPEGDKDFTDETCN
ncbi:MAG TPA: hypothetical protein VGB64_13435 [Actinomycetota bacterium]